MTDPEETRIATLLPRLRQTARFEADCAHYGLGKDDLVQLATQLRTDPQLGRAHDNDHRIRVIERGDLKILFCVSHDFREIFMLKAYPVSLDAPSLSQKVLDALDMLQKVKKLFTGL